MLLFNQVNTNFFGIEYLRRKTVYLISEIKPVNLGTTILTQCILTILNLHD